MLKKFLLIVLLPLWLSSGLLAQEVILFDQFDDGASQWGGWIDGGTTDVTVGVDTNGVLSGKNSYLVDVIEGGADTYRIQRNADCPLLANHLYTVSFLAVADRDVTINVLFEIEGDPYTKRLIEWPQLTTTPQVFTYKMIATEDVADNELKLHFGGPDNDNVKMWVDSIVVTQEPDPGLVDQWGLADYKAWPILNDSTTARGDASIGGESPHNWTSVRGSFGQDVSISTEQAIIVSGKMQFIGGSAGSVYTPLRYALTHQADEGELQYVGTDSAQWSVNGGHNGYSFMPRTGAGTMANGGGGEGTVWTINNGNWVSTWSNNGWPVAAIDQAPRNAEIIAGTYDFAISVQAIDDTTNEIRWYMVEETDKYWHGGIARDTANTTMFNGIVFGLETGDATQFNLTGVRFDLGDPIVVPEAPWESYYIDQWGLVQEYKTPWPILTDTLSLVGDGSIGGDVVSAWKGLQGGFGQDVSITTEKAVIVRGQIKFTGADAGAAYTPVRYALTYQDSSDLMYQYTDSAQWSGTGHHYGYGFHPRTGAGTMSNGAGGEGTVWTINNGNWASTWSNNGGPIAAVNQAPRNAEIIAGTYNFAISVHAIDEITNEIRWKMVEVENKYWFGGTAIDTATTKKFNSVIFGVNEVEFTQFDALAMEVDLGDPIVVPEAPWESYYIDQWGLVQEYKTPWPILTDTLSLVGDGSIGGDVVSAWKGLQGGFGQDVSITTEKAVIVRGQIKFTGADAGAAYTPVRYALTYQDSSELMYQFTDSAQWSGTGHHYGYGFHPRTGAGTMSNGNGGEGTVWTINDGNWASTWSNNGGPIAAVNQAPRNAEIIAGTYNFAISVHAIDEITNEIRWKMVEVEDKYWFGGTVIDTATTKKFNSVIFGVNEVEFTQFDALAMEVDLGDPITVPKAPWEDFYVDTWGVYGANTGGWQLAPAELTGNVDFNGTAAPTGWAVVRGDFGTVTPEPDVDILVVKGKIRLEGGGFEGSASLRFGLFNTDNAGGLDSTDGIGYNWNGTDDGNTGYLMFAQEGSNNTEAWGTGSGNWGRISDDVWHNYAGGTALGNMAPDPNTGGADTYDFAICVKPMGDGTSKIIWTLQKSGYYMEGGTIDNTPVATFNSIVVGINEGASATSMFLTDVQVTMADEEIPNAIESFESLIPVRFALNQNYPNPFNPSTTIEYALPQNVDVSLKVYDIAGRLVTELIKGTQNAGFYKIVYDASHLSTGIYFFILKAESFVDVKKMMLIK